MKKLAILLILLWFTTITVGAQESNIVYNKYYQVFKNSNKCILSILVTKSNCVLMKINQKTYKGFIKKNKNNEQEIYNFYCFAKNRKKFIMFHFVEENNESKVDIINQEYNVIFKPCFDEKYITLTIE